MPFGVWSFLIWSLVTGRLTASSHVAHGPFCGTDRRKSLLWGLRLFTEQRLCEECIWCCAFARRPALRCLSAHRLREPRRLPQQNHIPRTTT